MSIKVNIDVADFQKEMKRIEQEVSSLATADIHEKIDYATEQLKIVTPVDTGKARQGWENEKTISGPTLDTGLLIKEALGIGNKKTLVALALGLNPNAKQEGRIFNNVDYISVLNNGHSKQAPKYFIEQVLVKIGIPTPD